MPASQGGTGLTAPGASGNVLTSNGSIWTSAAGGGGGGFSTLIVLTSGTSWTAPTGITKIKVYATGGGGPGRWNASNQYFGGGGGTAIKYFTVVPGTSYTYAIGAGGIPNVTGGGGSTTFTVGAVTITGGGGGGPFQSTYPGDGGTATGGDINLPGQPGAFFTGTPNADGLGGGTFWAPYTSTFAGVVRNNPIYGAGGPANTTGANGVIVIEY